MSALIYFDNNQQLDAIDDAVTLRSLEYHFMSEEEPLSFQDYAKKVESIYRQAVALHKMSTIDN